MRLALPPLDDTTATSGVRQVSVTHDGRKIGHVEMLESDRALRIAVSRRVNFIASQEKARRGGGSLGAKIVRAQRQSATMREKKK